MPQKKKLSRPKKNKKQLTQDPGPTLEKFIEPEFLATMERLDRMQKDQVAYRKARRKIANKTPSPTLEKFFTPDEKKRSA